MPKTFVLVPSPKKNGYFWEESLLIFICPITLKPVGEGFPVKVPTSFLSKIQPYLEWGFQFLGIVVTCAQWQFPALEAIFPRENHMSRDNMELLVKQMGSHIVDAQVRERVISSSMQTTDEQCVPFEQFGSLSTLLRNCADVSDNPGETNGYRLLFEALKDSNDFKQW